MVEAQKANAGDSTGRRRFCNGWGGLGDKGGVAPGAVPNVGWG